MSQLKVIKDPKLRTAIRCRATIARSNRPRLSVHRSNQHIYCQIITAIGGKILASASTMDKSVREKVAKLNKSDQAGQVGTLIAERALAKGIKNVAFDRSGFRFHGRIRILAEHARSGGLNF